MDCISSKRCDACEGFLKFYPKFTKNSMHFPASNVGMDVRDKPTQNIIFLVCGSHVRVFSNLEQRPRTFA